MAQDRTAFFRSKAPKLMRRLIQEFDLAVDDGAAIAGNGGHESGGFQSLQELKPVVAGAPGGFGYFQWTGPRRRSYFAWCQQQGLDPKSDDANIGYLIWELRNTEKTAIPRTKAAQSLEGKVKAFELAFERAGVKHYESREKWARIAKAAYEAEKPIAPSIKTIATTTAIAVPAGAPVAVSHFHFSPTVVIVTIGLVVIAGVIAFAIHVYLKHRNSQRTIEGIAEEINMDPTPETTGTDAGSATHEEHNLLDEFKDRVEAHLDDFPDIKLKDLPRILDIVNAATQRLSSASSILPGLSGLQGLQGLSTLQGTTPIATPQTALDGKTEGMLSSTTIQGVIISVASKILAVTVGLSIPVEMQTQLAIILAGFIPDLIGNAMSFYGRLKAKSKIKVGG